MHIFVGEAPAEGIVMQVMKRVYAYNIVTDTELEERNPRGQNFVGVS